MKEVYNDKRFGQSKIFKCQYDFKKAHLATKLAFKPGRPGNIVNNKNANIVWTIKQENWRMTYQKITA